eukprot:137452-Prymnesium_polylepis.1
MGIAWRGALPGEALVHAERGRVRCLRSTHDQPETEFLDARTQTCARESRGKKEAGSCLGKQLYRWPTCGRLPMLWPMADVVARGRYRVTTRA